MPYDACIPRSSNLCYFIHLFIICGMAFVASSVLTFISMGSILWFLNVQNSCRNSLTGVWGIMRKMGFEKLMLSWHYIEHFWKVMAAHKFMCFYSSFQSENVCIFYATWQFWIPQFMHIVISFAWAKWDWMRKTAGAAVNMSQFR